MHILLRNTVRQLCRTNSGHCQNRPVRSTAKAVSVLAASTFFVGSFAFSVPSHAEIASCALNETDVDGNPVADPISNANVGLSLQLHQPMEKVGENTYQFYFYYRVRNYTAGTVDNPGKEAKNIQIVHDLSQHFPKAKSIKVPVSKAGNIFFVNDVAVNLDDDFDVTGKPITSDDTVILEGNDNFGQLIDKADPSKGRDWNVLKAGQNLPAGFITDPVPAKGAPDSDSPRGKAGIIGVQIEVDFGESLAAASGNATLLVDGKEADISTQGPVPDSDEPDFLHPPEGKERADICGPENKVPTSVYLPQPVVATSQLKICGKPGLAEGQNLVKNPYFSAFPKPDEIPVKGILAGTTIADSFSSDAVYIGNNRNPDTSTGASDNQISIAGGRLNGEDATIVTLHTDTIQQHPFPGDASRWEHKKPALRWLFSSGNNSSGGNPPDADAPFSIWKQTVSVEKGKTYAFSAYVSNPVWANRNDSDNAFSPYIQLLAGNEALLASDTDTFTLGNGDDAVTQTVTTNGKVIHVEDLAKDKGDVWQLLHGTFIAEGDSIDVAIQNSQPYDFLNKVAITGISVAECAEDKNGDGKADDVVDPRDSNPTDGGTSGGDSNSGSSSGGGGGGSTGFAFLMAGIPALLRRRKALKV